MQISFWVLMSSTLSSSFFLSYSICKRELSHSHRRFRTHQSFPPLNSKAFGCRHRGSTKRESFFFVEKHRLPFLGWNILHWNSANSAEAHKSYDQIYASLGGPRPLKKIVPKQWPPVSLLSWRHFSSVSCVPNHQYVSSNFFFHLLALGVLL